MSSVLSAELVATCNSLGYHDPQQGKYHADENTLESVKDLIRYLKRDDESHDIRRQLGETKVVQTDLLPLLKNYWEQTDLFDVLLRLLVNLTTPALMLWNEEVPAERTSRNQYLQIEEHLRLYKQAFADEAVWAVLSTRISKILEVESRERLDETGLVVERILILIRNVLHVPADADAERRPDNDASVHDQVLWALHQSGVLDIVLYVSSANEEAYYMHVVEIMCHMLREQNATELASAALRRSREEKTRDDVELIATRRRETDERRQKTRLFAGSRHSRFGGTFVVQSMKSISDNELIYHRPLGRLDELNFDGGKATLKTPKNRAPLPSGVGGERRSAFAIRLCLKEFCVEFVAGAYNTFMRVVRERLGRQQAQRHDETYYLWAMRFFLEFQRHYRFDVRLVSETVSVPSFEYVQRQLEHYSEMVMSDKKCARLWARRMRVALGAYGELLRTLRAMDAADDAVVQRSSAVIKSNIFYVLEYRELILHLLMQYDERVMSAEHLRDVIETQHVYLKLFQAHCAGKALRVEGRAPRRRRKPPPASKRRVERPVDLGLLWERVVDRLREHLDGAVAIREEVQWKVADMVRAAVGDASSDLGKLGVQKLVSVDEHDLAVGLMLEARELYPDVVRRFDDSAQQLDEFRRVFFASVEDAMRVFVEEQEEVPSDGDRFEGEEGDDDEEGGGKPPESDLTFADFGKRLAHPRIVRACAAALKDFERNSPLTNHCAVKLLHRVAFDAKMPAMLFQVSLFRVFQRVYEAKALPRHKELATFATYVVRQFFHVAATNPHVYMEALFWKSAREACDVEDAYASYNEKSTATTGAAWSEREEDELRRLFVEHRENAVERDVVDWIVENLVEGARTRRAVLKRLKEMRLLVDHAPSRKKAAKEWAAQEEEQLRALFARFAGATDPLTCIAERLDVRRPKNRVAEKILELGLARDKKELRKKRVGKSEGRFQYVGDDINSDDASNSDSDRSGRDDADNESEDRSVVRSSAGPVRPKTKKGAKKAKSKARTCAMEIAKMLVGLVGGDLRDGVDWLKESIEDAVEDWSDSGAEDDEGVPLVPIMDHSVSAMEDSAFLTLLRALDVQEPGVGGQEAYWRIPTSLSRADLRQHVEMLTRALDGSLVVEEALEAPPADDANDGNESDAGDLEKNKVANAIKRAKNEKVRAMIDKMLAEKSATEDDVELSVGHPEENQENVPKRKTKRRIVEDSSDEEPIDEDVLRDDESNRMSFKPTRIHDFSDEEDVSSTSRRSRIEEDTQEMFKSARIIMESSDEDGESVAESKRLRSTSDSEGEKPKAKRSRVIVSDDEEA